MSYEAIMATAVIRGLPTALASARLHCRQAIRWRISRVAFAQRTFSSAMASVTSAPKKVLVPIATGSEEMEVVIVVDILRRAGADVTVASVEEKLQITASRNVKLVADAHISACEGEKFDLIMLPGGMPGAEHLRDSKILQNIAQVQSEEKRMYAAICAAPAVALENWGLLKGLKATCHPSFTSKLSNQTSVESRVVKDGLAVTSRAPGTAIEFGLALVEQLYDKEKADEISKALIAIASKESWKVEFNDLPWPAARPGNPLVLVPIADGSEDMEAVILIDILRRAGMDVIVASVENDLQIVAARKSKIIADRLITDLGASKFDAIFLPGGMPGAEHLRDSETLTKMLTRQAEANRVYGAICASPAVVLETKKLLAGKKATAYPAFQAKLSDKSAVESRVVIDGLAVTSQGPGTAMEFALSIVEKFLGKEKALSTAAPMVFHYS